MSLRLQAFRGSAVLTVGEAVGYGAAFVRNMILARILTRADFGIAATFAIVVSLLEVSAKLGIARFIVRDKEGNDPVFIATAHTIQCGAALLSSIVIAAVAWPAAQLFGLQNHIAAFLVLAVIPLLQGFVHLDPRRFERELRFGASVLSEAVPQVVITLLAWPLGVWLGDYRVVLVLLLVKALLTCGAAWWLAEQPYRFRLHREYAMRMVRFGWPLLLNGFVTFFIVRGDQFLVASFYSMEDLGAYAAAASLTLVPTLFFTRIFASVMLPVMAKVQDDPVAFDRRYGLVVAVVCAFSAIYGVTVILGAEAFMQFVFGRQYQGSGVILGWLAVANASRNIRLAPAVAAVAKGDSMNQMISNLWAGASLLPALAVAIAGQPVWLIACSGLLGEALACAVSFRRLSRRDGVTLRRSLVPASSVGLSVIAAGAGTLLGVHQAPPLFSLGLAVFAGCIFGAIVVVALKDLRLEARKLWLHLEAKGLASLLPMLKGSAIATKPADS
jgi:O-antigen/teichoic acid export membrane protein